MWNDWCNHGDITGRYDCQHMTLSDLRRMKEDEDKEDYISLVEDYGEDDSHYLRPDDGLEYAIATLEDLLIARGEDVW